MELIDRTKLRRVCGYADGGDYLVVLSNEISEAPVIEPESLRPHGSGNYGVITNANEDMNIIALIVVTDR